MRNQQKMIEHAVGTDRFFTNPHLAARIVRWANLQHGANVLEPSAGGGAFVRAILDEVPGSRVTAVELDRVLAHRLGKWEAQNAAYAGRLKVFGEDFLSFKMKPGQAKPFDAAVMNPPYGSRKDGSVGFDAVHVAHALEFAPRAVGLLVTGFEHGVKRARTLFDDYYVSRRVVLVKRPPFDGPEDKGLGARRDHVVLEFKPYDEKVKRGMVIDVPTERWEWNYKGTLE